VEAVAEGPSWQEGKRALVTIDNQFFPVSCGETDQALTPVAAAPNCFCILPPLAPQYGDKAPESRIVAYTAPRGVFIKPGKPQGAAVAGGCAATLWWL